MKTYRIYANTNPYIAQRDSMFNGKESVTLQEGLSYDEARKSLDEYFCNREVYATHITSLDQFVRDRYYNLIEELAYGTGIKDTDKYFEMTKKRWHKLNELSNDEFVKFDGSGWYNEDKVLVFADNEDMFEFDGRYFYIEEE